VEEIMKFDHFKFLVDSVLQPDELGAVKQKYKEIRVDALNPLVLAYIGDAYFNLYVRGRLLAHEQNKVQVLHSFGAQIVSASWQSVAYHGIEELLTEEEKAVFRRGRNAKSHVPKSATVAEYRASTGFESLLGALYLEEKYERLQELVEKSFSIISQAMMNKTKVK
jgi:ribonuclease-3 family protein